MSGPRSRRPLPLLLGALALTALTACNAMLGIDAPKEAPIDPLTGKPTNTINTDEYVDFDDAGLPIGLGDAGPADAEVVDEDPSPYAWAAWPMPNPASLADAGNPQVFGTQAPDIVIDTVTKLEWQKVVDSKARSHEDAEAYCAKLPLAGGGFHLPSRIELLSLVDYTVASPYVDPTAFPGAPIGKYWSSSRYASSPAVAWSVNFEFGTSLVLSEPFSKERFVRCVR